VVEGLTGRVASLPPRGDAALALDALKRTHRVTISSLEVYIYERVKELTGGRQQPTTTKPDTIPNLTIAALGGQP
jgi:hypothetical protein